MKAGQRLELLESHPDFPIVLRIVERLKGELTVLAGGCVRDSLLGVRPKDLDIATAAKPDTVEAAFTRTLAVGKAFGTIVVVEDGRNFEVTTFREDGEYVDGRHPLKVNFSSIEEDAKRRDFTVNALFYDPLKREVLDFVGGLRDLERKHLRTVGRAAERFSEDKLRMLRAVRFVGQLGFTLDPAALKAIQADHLKLTSVSIERVFNEIKRLLESDHLRDGLGVLLQSKLHVVCWSEISGFELPTSLPKFLNWENAYSGICFLAGISDPEARLRAWKVSKDSMRRIQGQLAALNVLSDPSSSRAVRIRALGSDVYAETLLLASLKFGDVRTQEFIEEYLSVAGPDGQLPKPILTGEDLLKAGIAPGAQMGKILADLYHAQLEGRIVDRDAALKYIKTI